MVKIHILGGPGSGKTTLAQAMSSRFHIPRYDLDTVNLERGNALALVSHPAWITEGIYLISIEPMLYHADYIVLLEVSWPVASWRIIRRHLLNSLRGTQSYPGINGVKSLFKLLAYTGRYYLNQDHITRPSIESLQRYLETYQEIATPLQRSSCRSTLRPIEKLWCHLQKSLCRGILKGIRRNSFSSGI